MPRYQPPVQHNLQPKGRQVDIPTFDQRLQKRRTVLLRNAERIRIQKLQDADSQPFVTSPCQTRYRTQPGLVVQFVLRASLHHVQQLLRDQSFHVAERVRLKYRSHLPFLARRTLSENQLANVLEQRHRSCRQSFLQPFVALVLRKLRQLPGAQVKKSSDLFVNVSSAWRRWQFLGVQQLRNVRLRDLRRHR